MQELVVAFLVTSCFSAGMCGDGIKGQALAMQENPDLNPARSDAPQGDGLTVCQRLRRNERSAGSRSMTHWPWAGNHYKVSGFSTQADDYLTKPL